MIDDPDKHPLSPISHKTMATIGEAMDEPQFSLAFVMVKESFVIPAICFYLESATRGAGNDLNLVH
jgi:hypothetical protein